jgi:hypothetical protein
MRWGSGSSFPIAEQIVDWHDRDSINLSFYAYP